MEGAIDTPVKAKPRSWRRWLNYCLQALWVITAIYTTQLMILSIPIGYEALMRVCTEPVCPDGQLTTESLANLEALGISLEAYAVIQLISFFAIALIYAIVSLLIFRAKPNDTVALYTALVLLPFGTFVSSYVDILRTVQPNLSDVVDIMPGVTLIAFAILCYIFPDGRFVPKWTRWAAWGWVAAPVILVIAALNDVYEPVEAVMAIVLLVLLGTCIIAPIHRYRKLSTRSQRQQLKWVLFGLTQFLLVLLVLVELLPYAFPQLDVVGTLPNLISYIIQVVSVIIFPITIGIALLRYRLWNVDLVINRSLVYIPLTSILTVIYTTSMAVSQRLFTTVTGEQSQAVAIFTTIVLTTTFTPIKNALQSFVDRHFKEAPGNLKELKELDKEVTQVVQALDHKSVAQRVVETIVKANSAKGAALYFRENGTMYIAYSTPNWTWNEDGEVSILLSEGDVIYGRLLLGESNDSDEYSLDEIEEIRAATLPIVRNMQKLVKLHPSEEPPAHE
jgi:hypothetical protein